MTTIFSTIASPSKWLPKVSFPSMSNANVSNAGTWAKDAFAKTLDKVPSVPARQILQEQAGKAASTAMAHPFLTLFAAGVGYQAYKFLTSEFGQLLRTPPLRKSFVTMVKKQVAIQTHPIALNASPEVKARLKAAMREQILDFKGAVEEWKTNPERRLVPAKLTKEERARRLPIWYPELEPKVAKVNQSHDSEVD